MNGSAAVSRPRAVEDALAVAQLDPASGCIHIERALNLDETTGAWILGRYDLTSSEGWGEAQANTRQRILEAALHFLRTMPESHPNAALDNQIPMRGIEPPSS